MADYVDLFRLKGNSALRNKVTVAVVIKAKALLDASPTAGQIAWANEAFDNPIVKANSLLNYVLADNSDQTVENIESASDSAIQTAVNGAVDALIS